jgi:hypothetical protein
VISLILPYWRRQQAANEALALLARHYAADLVEVIVVDDGDPVPFVDPGYRPIKVVRLPEKRAAMATCVPLNRGVEASTGDLIALSCVEMLHNTPVLYEMEREFVDAPDNTYVLAAVRCDEQDRWHCHSSVAGKPCEGIPMPEGSGLNFLSMMRRSFWDRVGGFDEDYRKGIAFDDNDFVKRLEKAGAKFIIRDDLIVQHPRKGAKALYIRAQHEHNRQLFVRKWAHV